MHSLTSIFRLTTLCFTLFGSYGLYAQAPIAPQQTTSENIVATVNDGVITNSQVAAYQLILKQQLRGQTPEKALVVEELIKMSLLAEAAVKQNLNSRPEVEETLILQRNVVLSALMQQELIVKSQPEEAELEKVYDELPNQEFRVNYILVDTKDLAEEVIAKLKDDITFSSLAKVYSIDQTGQHGGNLGWINALQINTELVHALAKLRPGKFTNEPVESPQGWQIAQVLETRDFTKPPYFQVRDQLLQLKLQEKLLAYIEKLKSEAKITRK